ncbi:MAG: phage portal protein [Candidatus Peribacteraceae bacterium]|nr:phage portal protein [Candidatus Peribacteraceae bacterium]
MAKKKTFLQQEKDAAKRLHIRQLNYQSNMLKTIEQAVLPQFAQDPDEATWSALTTTKRIFTEADVIKMQDEAMRLYYEDPGARCIIDTMVNFVVGKDAHITPADKSPRTKKWWDLFTKSNKFDKRMKEMVKRTFRDGEAFTRLYRNSKKGEPLLMRFVDPQQIKDSLGRGKNYTYGIQVDPNDVETVIAYWLKNGKSIPAKEMVHSKILVDSNVKRGVSFLVGVAKYIVKYGGWLDDRIMINKIRTIFHMVMKVSGISPAGMTDQFSDTTGKTPTGGTPNKQLPKPGSTLVSSPGLEYEFKNLNIRAQDTKDDGRLIELQVAKGTNLTEYIVRGDSSNSNYSSTMVSESPMVRNFEARQDEFEEYFQEIYARVIQDGKRQGKVPKNASEECEVNFSALIHRNVKEETEAYAIQNRVLKIVSKKTISEKMGYDYEKELKLMEDEEKEEGFNEEDESEENNITEEIHSDV